MGNARPVPQFSRDRQALLEQRPARSKIALPAGHNPQVRQRVDDARPVPQFPRDRQALLVQRPGGGMLHGHIP